MTKLSTYWRAIAGGTRHSPADWLVTAVLVPFSIPYALIQSSRAWLYRQGGLTTRRLPRPVVSIGNLAVGGTGKTPVTAYIARYLLDRGLKVAVLTRGYGGTMEGQTAIVSDGRTLLLTATECGDEPYLLASTIPGLMVVMGSDRHAAGTLAMQQLSPDIFLLDDGFQHLGLYRDLDILLLDCQHPFGNGWILPAGLLREPQSAAGRADLVIMTRCNSAEDGRQVVPDKPTCRARHDLSQAVPLTGGAALPLEALRGKRLLAFSGIAAPDSFFNGLVAHGLDLVATLPFPDHVAYDQRQLKLIAARMQKSGAEFAITTEKDGVKLTQLPPEIACKTYLAPLLLAIDDPSPLHGQLDILPTTKNRPSPRK